MGQALFNPLILGIYFRRSDFSNRSLTIVCTDVSKLYPGVSAGRQLSNLSSQGGCKCRHLN